MLNCFLSAKGRISLAQKTGCQTVAQRGNRKLYRPPDDYCTFCAQVVAPVEVVWSLRGLELKDPSLIKALDTLIKRSGGDFLRALNGLEAVSI